MINLEKRKRAIIFLRKHRTQNKSKKDSLKYQNTMEEVGKQFNNGMKEFLDSFN